MIKFAKLFLITACVLCVLGPGIRFAEGANQMVVMETDYTEGEYLGYGFYDPGYIDWVFNIKTPGQETQKITRHLPGQHQEYRCLTAYHNGNGQKGKVIAFDIPVGGFSYHTSPLNVIYCFHAIKYDYSKQEPLESSYLTAFPFVRGTGHFMYTHARWVFLDWLTTQKKVVAPPEIWPPKHKKKEPKENNGRKDRPTENWRGTGPDKWHDIQNNRLYNAADKNEYQTGNTSTKNEYIVLVAHYKSKNNYEDDYSRFASIKIFKYESDGSFYLEKEQEKLYPWDDTFDAPYERHKELLEIRVFPDKVNNEFSIGNDYAINPYDYYRIMGIEHETYNSRSEQQGKIWAKIENGRLIVSFNQKYNFRAEIPD